MEYSCLGLNDLADEILMIIFKKLDNIEVLYSLLGVNQRLNKIVHDSVFTNSLFLFNELRNDMIRDRFCSKILPEIHDKIEWLHLESSHMKHVLHATKYPNLYGLGLYNINENLVQCLFNALYEPSYQSCARLNFNDSLHPYIRSSTLLKLNISVQCFDDCLCILDGRFNQLYSFSVDLGYIHIPEEMENRGDLPNLNELVIIDVHDDYIEEFLFDTKTYLPYNIILHINHESLQRVTNNFTRDATRINCAKINKLNLTGELKCSNSLKEYFPYAEIRYPLIH
ncbi:unnamed protein product [Rotaria sordida]|uniref:F-box domain-containing protein n=1 Tax=Rotaria sordida TaxID=392033 RepID=A0A816F769_9BILA|nr:unnamed protein product [Rotaria sordida]CAF1659573.1 unnamed protein product [Rotaria sordida]